ncbi:MAG: hypothetical protein ABFC77_09160 [Thermoguttaceae bacterium]
MLDAGLRPSIHCVDPKKLLGDFVGREWSRTLLAELPTDVIHTPKTASFTP